MKISNFLIFLGLSAKRFKPCGGKSRQCCQESTLCIRWINSSTVLFGFFPNFWVCSLKIGKIGGIFGHTIENCIRRVRRKFSWKKNCGFRNLFLFFFGIWANFSSPFGGKSHQGCQKNTLSIQWLILLTDFFKKLFFFKNFSFLDWKNRNVRKKFCACL